MPCLLEIKSSGRSVLFGNFDDSCRRITFIKLKQYLHNGWLGEINESSLASHQTLSILSSLPNECGFAATVDFLRCPHFFKTGFVASDLPVLRILSPPLSAFLTTEYQKVFRARKQGEENHVRHRINNDIFTLIIECFRRIAGRNIFLHKTSR